MQKYINMEEVIYLSAYLPYGVKLASPKFTTGGRAIMVLRGGHISDSGLSERLWLPVLRPMSDLVKKCELECDEENGDDSWVGQLLGKNPKLFDYRTYAPNFNNHWEFVALVKNHFDVFGLIDKGQALDVNKL